MVTHGLGNMVAFIPEIGFLACSLVQLAYICVPALDYHSNLKQSHICNRAALNQVKMRLCHGGSKDQCLLPCFIFIDSELVLSFLHFKVDFLACSSVRHACIYVCGHGSHDNLKQRHIRKRAEVNQVWVLVMACRIEDCSKTCSSIHIINATMPWTFQHQSFPCCIMIDSVLVQTEALGDWMGAPVYSRTVEATCIPLVNICGFSSFFTDDSISI